MRMVFLSPARVVTGWRFGDRVEIVEGLMPEEQIVISGNFLIDSESRMKLAAAGLYGIPEKDPICGLEVYPSRARAAGLTSEFGGKTYYFFTKDCKDQFDKEHGQDPDKPAGEARPAPGHPAAPTTTLRRTGLPRTRCAACPSRSVRPRQQA